MRRGPLESGRRDRLVTIQQLTETDSDSGMPVETWTDLVSSMPASKEDVSGRERFVSSQESARFDTRWVINYRADMDPELVDVPKVRRIVYSGRAHDITSATHLGRKDGIELMTLAAARLPAVVL